MPNMGTDWSVSLFYSGNIDAALTQVNVVLGKSPAFQPGLYNKGLFLWHKSQMTTGSAQTSYKAQAKTALQAAIKINSTNQVGKDAAQVLARTSSSVAGVERRAAAARRSRAAAALRYLRARRPSLAARFAGRRRPWPNS